MFTKLLDALKATRRTIVFTEGPDARILEATDRLLKEDLMDVILIGNEAEVKAAAEKGNFCICKATIIDPAKSFKAPAAACVLTEVSSGTAIIQVRSASSSSGSCARAPRRSAMRRSAFPSGFISAPSHGIMSSNRSHR